MITYILESTFFQLLFLLFYLVALRRMTFFRSNRLYLVLSLVASLILPAVSLPQWKNTSLAAIDLPILSQNLIRLDTVILGPGADSSALPWTVLIWVLGALANLCWLVFRMNKLRVLMASNRIEKQAEDIRIVRLPATDQAFSFFHWIFLGERLEETQQKRILDHEIAHVRQWHSLDLLLVEALRIPLWFNPLLWVYRRLLDEVHEYVADAFAASGNPPEHYYRELLGQVFGVPSRILGHNFFKRSLIVKRINMLQRKSTHKSSLLTYVLVLPLIAGMLWVSSCEQEAEPLTKPQSTELSEAEKLADYQEGLIEILKQDENLNPEQREAILKNIIAMIENPDDIEFSEEKMANSSVNSKDERYILQVPFSVIEEVPVFPGCEDAADRKACFNEKIIEHIRKHFNYPEEAQEQGLQGKVSSMFTVNVDGTIGDIRTRGPHAILEQEVVRILSQLPRMQPGLHEGGAVKVPFSVPILFKLD